MLFPWCPLHKTSCVVPWFFKILLRALQHLYMKSGLLAWVKIHFCSCYEGKKITAVKHTSTSNMLPNLFLKNPIYLLRGMNHSVIGMKGQHWEYQIGFKGLCVIFICGFRYIFMKRKKVYPRYSKVFPIIKKKLLRRKKSQT